MNYKKFDLDNLFEEPFRVDPNLIKRVGELKETLEKKYRCTFKLLIIQGARTDQSNMEYYQKKYGEDWKRHYNKNSLHIVREDTGMILRAVDIAFERDDGIRLTGQEIYRTIQEEHLFGNVGIAEYYVHVDTLIRIWRYKV